MKYQENANESDMEEIGFFNFVDKLPEYRKCVKCGISRKAINPDGTCNMCFEIKL